MSISVGDVVGQYRVEKLIGQGSMADVYLATHLPQNKPVAIKLIHSFLITQAGFFERFKREAEVMASLRHPHIAQLNEFVCQDDLAYIVMEYLPGGTLEDRIAESRASGQDLPLAQIMDWLEAICGAVDYAHRNSLIHRDIKPANILFRSSTEPVLTDFGLAYLLDRPRLSGSNAITGTPAYLSPEQGRGAPTDARSDVYSLGVILYELLTGQTPFQGSAVSVVMKHISEPPPSPRSFGRYLPAGVEGVIMRALAKNQAERYPTAGALARALRTTIERSVKTTPAAPEENAESKAAAKTAASTAAESAAPATPPRRSPEPPPPTPRPVAPRRPRPASGAAPEWILPLVFGLIVVVGLAGATWWGITQVTGERPSTAPEFAEGSQVRVVVPGGVSISAVAKCPTGLANSPVGIVSEGDEGKVLERTNCGKEWWYRVSFPQFVSANWNGEGWVPGKNLKQR